MANHPSAERTPSANRYLPPLDENRWSQQDLPDDGRRRDDDGPPCITVTRQRPTAAVRWPQMYDLVQRAATADGADKSG